MTSWVLIDETNGAPCGNGETLDPVALAHIAEACTIQANRDYAPEHGGDVRVRVGKDATDILSGECAYVFKATLPEAPGASAYHDNNGEGVQFAFCAVTTCKSLLGPDGCGVDASHEVLETEGDPGCNKMADDNRGTLHACEDCDAVEVQQYPVTCADGTVVYVSNFVLRSWYNPNGQPPYDYMSKAGIPGATAPPGPMQTAPGDGGNYQIEEPSNQAQETQVFAKAEAPTRSGRRISGKPRKPEAVAHWNSRASRRKRAARSAMPTVPALPDTGHGG